MKNVPDIEDKLIDVEGDSALLNLAVSDVFDGRGDHWDLAREIASGRQPKEGRQCFVISGRAALAIVHARNRVRDSVDVLSATFYGDDKAGSA